MITYVPHDSVTNDEIRLKNQTHLNAGEIELIFAVAGKSYAELADALIHIISRLRYSFPKRCHDAP